MYYVGIDAGGTKTRFVSYNEAGEFYKETIKTTCHVLQVPTIEAIKILTEGIKEVTDNGTYRLCIGIAGYGKNKDLRAEIENICEKSFEKDSYVIHSDAEIALYGALEGKDGLLLISGTGSIVLGKYNGEFMRCGGWGYNLGDEGSAYWIGKKILQEYTKQCDGRSPETILKNRIKEHFDIRDDYDIISVVDNKRDEIAALAVIASELAKNGDEACLKIYDESAKELAELCNVLSKRFKDKCYVAVTGGVWKSGHFFKELFREYLNSKIIIVDSRHEPVYGAYLLAREK